MKTIHQALQESYSKEGFTAYLEKQGRYIVGLTHLKNPKEELLQAIVDSMPNVDNVTVGGWTDVETETTYIDVGLAFDNLETALNIGKSFAQLAIWDNVDFKEIRIA